MPSVRRIDVSRAASASARRRPMLLAGFLVAVATGGSAWYAKQHDKADAPRVSPRVAGAQAPAPKAPPPPRLIRSVRNFASLQVVKVEQKKFNRHVVAAAKEHRIDPALLRAVIQVESNYAPRAVSRVGARGLMQLMPATARELGVRRVRKLYDPRVNIRTGAAYLSHLADRFGEMNADLIIAAYNAGPGAVTRWGGIPPYPETMAYVRKVAALWGTPLSEGTEIVVTG